jgi:hypothetical protein
MQHTLEIGARQKAGIVIFAFFFLVEAAANIFYADLRRIERGIADATSAAANHAAVDSTFAVKLDNAGARASATRNAAQVEIAKLYRDLNRVNVAIDRDTTKKIGALVVKRSGIESQIALERGKIARADHNETLAGAGADSAQARARAILGTSETKLATSRSIATFMAKFFTAILFPAMVIIIIIATHTTFNHEFSALAASALALTLQFFVSYFTAGLIYNAVSARFSGIPQSAWWVFITIVFYSFYHIVASLCFAGAGAHSLGVVAFVSKHIRRFNVKQQRGLVLAGGFEPVAGETAVIGVDHEKPGAEKTAWLAVAPNGKVVELFTPDEIAPDESPNVPQISPGEPVHAVSVQHKPTTRRQWFDSETAPAPIKHTPTPQEEIEVAAETQRQLALAIPGLEFPPNAERERQTDNEIVVEALRAGVPDKIEALRKHFGLGSARASRLVQAIRRARAQPGE